MEIAIWIAVQAAMFGLVWWFVSSRRAKAERTIKRRPTERAREENAELRQLRAMRAKSLNMPLSEKARPTRMEDIVGQQEGIRALRAAMCGPNPQHVLIYAGHRQNLRGKACFGGGEAARGFAVQCGFKVH